MTSLPLSELLGATVYDPSGAASGRVREVTLAPRKTATASPLSSLKPSPAIRVLPFSAVSTIDANIHASTNPADWPAANGSEGLFLLERDLLDQQVIDINGRKVVRVNDVELQIDSTIEGTARPCHPARSVRRYRRPRRGPPSATRPRTPRCSRGSSPADSSPHHPLEFRRSHRDRSRTPHQTQNFSRRPGQAPSRRHRRHRRRPRPR